MGGGTRAGVGDAAKVGVGVGRGVAAGGTKGRGMGMDSEHEVTVTAKPAMMGRACLTTFAKILVTSACVFVPWPMGPL